MAERAVTDIVQLKLRIREELRARLEKEAADRRISLNAAIASRLERSFSEDLFKDSFGRGDLFAAMHLFAKAVRRAEQKTGKNWTEDLATYTAGLADFVQILEQLAPTDGAPLNDRIFEALIEHLAPRGHGESQ